MTNKEWLKQEVDNCDYLTKYEKIGLYADIKNDSQKFINNINSQLVKYYKLSDTFNVKGFISEYEAVKSIAEQYKNMEE